MSQQRVTPERITHLEKNEIFVFGSNLAGAPAHDVDNIVLPLGW